MNEKYTPTEAIGALQKILNDALHWHSQQDEDTQYDCSCEQFDDLGRSDFDKILTILNNTTL